MREVTALQSPQSTELSTAPHPSTESRLAALVGGAALLTIAARDRSWRGVGLALAGAPLVWRGATGSWPIQRTQADPATESALPSIQTSLTIARPRQELWDFYRQLENLPRFMRHLESVEDLGDGRSHWVAKSPVGLRVEWDAEIVSETEGHQLAWRSLPGSQVYNAGSVSFEDAPADRGTIVRVEIEAQPGNALGRVVGRALSPMTEQQVHEDFRRFKSLMEAGEIPTNKKQSAGHRSAINIRNPF